MLLAPYTQLSKPQASPFTSHCRLSGEKPEKSVRRTSFAPVAVPSPSASAAYKMFGAAHTSTPLRQHKRPVGNGKWSRKTVALSYRPSPSVSVSTFTRPPGVPFSCSPVG